jgi:hypothetical protein
MAFWPSMLTQEQAVEIRVMARRGEGAETAATVQARPVQGLPWPTRRAGQAAVDTGDGAAARDRRARLRRRHQPAQGVAGAAEDERARARGALRDAAGPAAASRLHGRAPRPRSAAGAGGDHGLQPRHLREVHDARRRRHAVRTAVRSCRRHPLPMPEPLRSSLPAPCQPPRAKTPPAAHPAPVRPLPVCAR